MLETQRGSSRSRGVSPGRVSRALAEERLHDARSDLDRLAQIFGRDSTYVELQNAGLEEQKQINPKLVGLAEEAGLPLVATEDVHYLDAEDAYAHGRSSASGSRATR